jgi:hypothetical protein
LAFSARTYARAAWIAASVGGVAFWAGRAEISAIALLGMMAAALSCAAVLLLWTGKIAGKSRHFDPRAEFFQSLAAQPGGFVLFAARREKRTRARKVSLARQLRTSIEGCSVVAQGSNWLLGMVPRTAAPEELASLRRQIAEVSAGCLAEVRFANYDSALQFKIEQKDYLRSATPTYCPLAAGVLLPETLKEVGRALGEEEADLRFQVLQLVHAHPEIVVVGAKESDSRRSQRRAAVDGLKLLLGSRGRELAKRTFVGMGPGVDRTGDVVYLCARTCENRRLLTQLASGLRALALSRAFGQMAKAASKSA